MRNNNSFVSGMVAGMAIGAMLVVAFTPQVRGTVWEGMGRMMSGRRMRRIMKQGSDMVESMMPGDAN